MKTNLSILLLLAAWSANANAITVVEISNPIGGIGIGGSPTLNTQYEYQVTVGPAEDLIQFNVGATDISTVQNIQGPGGGGAFEVNINAGADEFTSTGVVNPGGAPDFALAPYIIGWVPQVGAGVYYFGYDAPGSTAQDMGWTAAGISASPGNESWTQPVGMGLGPVHGPGPRVPEPASMALAMVGLIAIGKLRSRSNGQ